MKTFFFFQILSSTLKIRDDGEAPPELQIDEDISAITLGSRPDHSFKNGGTNKKGTVVYFYCKHQGCRGSKKLHKGSGKWEVTKDCVVED